MSDQKNDVVAVSANRLTVNGRAAVAISGDNCGYCCLCRILDGCRKAKCDSTSREDGREVIFIWEDNLKEAIG